jgi:hypothetical protein
MDLRTYFLTTKPEERRALAEKIGRSVEYLYLCTRPGRKPGVKLCKALVEADSRFTLADLRPDLWGDGIDSYSASDDAQPPVGSGPKKGDKLARVIV